MSSDLVQASNTMCGGPLIMREGTSSLLYRDYRSSLAPCSAQQIPFGGVKAATRHGVYTIGSGPSLESYYHAWSVERVTYF